MAFKRKNKTRNVSNYKITIDQLHKNMSQSFIDEFKTLKKLNEDKNELEINISYLKSVINEDLIPDFEKQKKLLIFENDLEKLETKILDIENNKMEKSYLLKSGKLLNNYYKLLNKEKQQTSKNSLLDFDLVSNNNDNIELNNKELNNKEQNNDLKLEYDNIENNLEFNNLNISNSNIDSSNNNNSNKKINSEKNILKKKNTKKNVLDWLNEDFNSELMNNELNNDNYNNIEDKLIKNDNNLLSKRKIYDNYMKIIDKNYVSDNVYENSDELFDICINCKSEMVLNHNTGMLNCKGCGMTEKIIIDSDKQSHKDPPKEMTSFSYKRINHLTEILSQFQAKETTEIPDYIYDKILIELKKERINNMCNLTTDKLRSILKKIDETDYYEHMPYIINQLNGLPPPIISPEVEEIIKSLFLQTQYPFNKYCPDDRKNFLTYGYTLYKLFELLELDEYLVNFKFLKNRKKLYAQEQVWKKICNELKWEFIPSI